MGIRDETERQRRLDRRDFIKKAAAGTALVALGGGLYRLASDDVSRAARAERRPDGRPRLPPGQRVIEKLRPMGGQPGSGKARDFELRVHGAVAKPFTLDFKELVEDFDQVEREVDVHCVTGWSVLGATFKGVRIRDLAERAKVKKSARHLILEAAHGYTANVRLREGTTDDCLVTYELDGAPFALKHGAPVRGLIPDLYFWKSAKWITGLRFVEHDEPGYWEVRGYHNHADPWREERHG